MTDGKSDCGTPDGLTKTGSQWACYAGLGGICALVIGVYIWSARPGAWELSGLSAADTYYNLLVRGLRAGRLDLPREVPSGLAGLADPYDPAANAPYRAVAGVHDASFYQAKFYLYFGITPALILFWPWYEITGRFLLHADAVLVFCVAGFLAGAVLFLALWRRYFAEVSVGVVAACVLALGLAGGLPLLLARGGICEVPISCGYALTMLALALVWRALHAGQKRLWWLTAASVAYGLALGARPSLLFGAVILLVPVFQNLRCRVARDNTSARCQVTADEKSCPPALVIRHPLSHVSHVLAAVGPIVIIGSGLMLYNALRFDDPLEFGQRYQLSSDRQGSIQHFSARYLWFNVWYYFLQPARWGGRFHFALGLAAPPLPAGHAAVEYSFGILTNIPVVWFALAAPLAGRGRWGGRRSGLGGFGIALILLFAISTVTLCLYSYTIARFEVEFLPTLVLLAVLGILGLERALARRRVWRHVTRLSWGVLLVFSVAFNLFARYELYADTCHGLGVGALRSGRADEAVAYLQKTVAMQPGSAQAHNDLAAALSQNGRVVEAIAHLEQALRLKPADAEAHNNLGKAFFQRGNMPEAIGHFQEALRLQPRDGEAHNNLGTALLQLGRVPEAIGHYEAALRLQPDDGKARNNLAIVLWQLGERLAAQGKWSEAIGQYERSLALKPDNAPAHDSWGLALSRLGRYREAVAEYEKALALDPRLASARNNLAWTLATCQDGSLRNGVRAVELAERANQAAGGKDAAILDALAAAYAEAGRFADAVRTAQNAVELMQEAGRAEVAQPIQARLQLYQAGRPYHEESRLGP